MKCNQSRPGFELMSFDSFPTTITIKPRAPPKLYCIYWFAFKKSIIITLSFTTLARTFLFLILLDNSMKSSILYSCFHWFCICKKGFSIFRKKIQCILDSYIFDLLICPIQVQSLLKVMYCNRYFFCKHCELIEWKSHFKICIVAITYLINKWLISLTWTKIGLWPYLLVTQAWIDFLDGFKVLHFDQWAIIYVLINLNNWSQLQYNNSSPFSLHPV